VTSLISTSSFLIDCLLGLVFLAQLTLVTFYFLTWPLRSLDFAIYQQCLSMSLSSSWWKWWNRLYLVWHITWLNDYKYSMTGCSQDTTWFEFNCTAATQGSHHVIHLILPMPHPSERRTSQLYKVYGMWTQFASSMRQILSTTLWPSCDIWHHYRCLQAAKALLESQVQVNQLIHECWVNCSPKNCLKTHPSQMEHCSC